MKKQIEKLRSNLDDKIKGSIQLEAYQTNHFELEEWTLTSVLDDILMVQYTDSSESGREVYRNGILVPIDVATYVWRVGRVILSGPNCKYTKKGDHVIFPNDKGIRASSINGLKNIVFLNESRIFGVCKPTRK